MAMKEVGARFSNSEYLKAGFDFVEEAGAITITTPEGTTEYEIGGGSSDTNVIQHELTLDTENQHLDMDKTTTEILAELGAGSVPVAIYNNAWHAITVISAGQAGNIFAFITNTGSIANGSTTGFSVTTWNEASA